MRIGRLVWVYCATLAITLSVQARAMPPADSLVSAVRAMPLALQVDILIKEAQKNIDNDGQKAIQLSLKAMQIADSSEDNTLIAKAAFSCGMTYVNQNNYAKGEQYLRQALELQISNSTHDSSALANTLKELGNLEKGRSNYTEALSYLFSALHTYQQLKDSTEIAYTLNSVGAIYITLRKQEKGLAYLLQAAEMRKQLGDLRGLTSTYNNLGIAYSDLQQNEKALEYYFKTLEYAKKIKFEKGIALSYNNIGHVYFTMKDYANAFRFYQTSLSEVRRLNLQSGTSAVLVNLTDLLTAQKKYREALVYGKEAFAISRIMGDKNRISEACFALSNTYAQMGKFDKAYELQTQYALLRDSLYNEAEAKESATMDAQYQNKENQKAIELLVQQRKITELELHRKENMIYFYSIAGLMLVVVVIMLYSRNRVRQKANRELARQNHEIREQSIEILLQTDIIRAAHHKITDSIRYAQRIQQSILPENATIAAAFPESFIFFKPLDLVSGDFYWFDKIDNCYVWVAADCTGHGVPGALMTMMGNTLLHEIVSSQRTTEPSQILYAIEKGIRENLHRTNAHNADENQNTDGMDLAVCTICPDTKQIFFAGANRPLYMVRNNELHEFRGSKYSTGGMTSLSQKVFETVQIEWQATDTFYLCSDGYADQFGGKSERKFMAKNLKNLLVEINQLPMPEQKNKIEETFYQWKGHLPQTDDVMLIGFKMKNIA